MHGKVVLVCSDRARTWRQVTPPLAGAGNQLVHGQSTERSVELLHSGAVDLALVEWPSGVDLDAVVEAAGERVPLVVLVSETGIKALEELICRRGLMHLCAARPEQEASAARVVDPAELVVTCEKILRRDIFGLDKYLAGFGIERPSRVIMHAAERDGLVAQLTEAVRALGAGRRVVESVSLVADELFTNAVYNAPRDPDGVPRYAHVNRREKIALEPGEYVHFEFGSDGRTFGLSISDGFGALAPEVLRGAIQRCVSRHDPIEQKAGGAGIGLYAALCHADQLVFNLAPGQRTEVIGLWNLARKIGGRGAGVASLHVFDGAGEPAGQGADASGQSSVELSDAVKNEIFAALVDQSEAWVSLTPPVALGAETVRDTLVAPRRTDTVATPAGQPAVKSSGPVAEEAVPASAADAADESPVAAEIGSAAEAPEAEAADPVAEPVAAEVEPAEIEPFASTAAEPVADEAQVAATAEENALEVTAEEPALEAAEPPALDADDEVSPPVDEAPEADDPTGEIAAAPDADEQEPPEQGAESGLFLEVMDEMVMEAEDQLDDDEPSDDDDDDPAGDDLGDSSAELTPVREPDAGPVLEFESGMLLAQEIDPGTDGADPEDDDVTVAEDAEDRLAAAAADQAGDEADGEPEHDESVDEAVDIDMADLYEMATVMEETGLMPTAPSGPPWLGPLTCLRGVQVQRRTDGPGFESALPGVRAAATLADAIESLLGYMVGHWSAAMLLCRVNDKLVPWTAAGDVDSWEELCEMEVPLGQGWLSARSIAPGVTLAPLDEDATARRLAGLLTSQDADQGVAVSFVLDQSVLVVFGCRWRANAVGDSQSDYEDLQRELSELTARIDRFSRLPTMRRQSARANM